MKFPSIKLPTPLTTKLPALESATSSSLFSPLLLLWLSLNLFIAAAYGLGFTQLGKENGPLENAQVALLFIAFLVALIKWRDDLGRRFQFLLWGAGLLAISFFLRELDLRRTGLSDWIIFFTSEKGRTWLTILLWLPMFYVVGRHFRWALDTVLCFTRSESFWLYVVAAIWLVGGAFFDKGIIATDHKYFMEEILELNGYGFFLLAMVRMRAAEALSHCQQVNADHPAMPLS